MLKTQQKRGKERYKHGVGILLKREYNRGIKGPLTLGWQTIYCANLATTANPIILTFRGGGRE